MSQATEEVEVIDYKYSSDPNIEQMILDRLAKIDEHCKELTKQRDNVPVSPIIFLERDEEKQLTGEVSAAYILEPHLLSKIKAMDMLVAGKLYAAGNLLYPVCVIECDPKIANNKARVLGLTGALGKQIDIEIPDVKKN